ncbi:uncharacterized protein EAF02_008879 [Botrytis sinoallii]|uniref:uncharacterized protein n=1 Tax=Botrytis sinoallii TaxID=1463999 RepID=UPI001900CBAB|nr:uncharacterized protein EAF02_008879 [Botrytis sinoallii]KAF7872808.1 hypothetical protein EAF02_008879 [Botrytis sinoallii]
MLGNWSQGGPQGPPHNYNNNYTGPPQNYNNSYNAPVPNKTPRLPICFTCGQEGHYVKDCPNQNQSGQAAMVAPQTTNVNGYGAPPQTKQWANAQNGQMGSKYGPYAGPGSAPMSQFTDPGQNSQFNGPMPSAPSPLYQQHSTPNPQQQGPPQQAYPNQQSVANGANYNHPSQQQHGSQGYQAPYNQHPQSSSPQQYGPPTHSQNGPQYPPPSAPATPFQPQNNGYNQGYNSRSSSVPHQSNGTSNHGQWIGSPPVVSPPNGPQQQQGQLQSNPGYNREFRRSQSQQSQQSEGRIWAQQGESRVGSQQPQQSTSRAASQNPSMASPEVNKRGLYVPRSKNTTLTAPSKASSQPAEVPIPSRASSVASTPFGSPSSGDNISEWDGQPAVLKEDSHRTDEEKQFNWDYKKIFQAAGERHETVALAQPLANRFDMTPVPLIDKKSTISISRYARKENLKEYRQSVRKTPQWPYLQEDPTFQELSAGDDSVSFQELDAFMMSRHGDAHVSITTRKATAANIQRTGKRKPSPTDQDDIDEQLQADISTLKNNKRQKVDDQSFKSADSLPRFCGDNASNNSPPLPEAPDDIWAPQAGESADPTEALLASLGVSGAPKPVEPGPPVMIPIEDLQQPIYSPQQPLYENQQTPYNSQNTQHNQQPIFNTQQQPLYTQQPPFNAQQPPFNAQQSPFNAQHSSFNAQQPPYSSQHQPAYNQQPTFNAQQQPPYNRQPSFNAQQPPYNPHQTPYNAQQPPYNQQPPFNTEQRPFNAQQPPFVAQQHPFSPQQPPYNAQQPYNAQRHPFNPTMAGQPFRQDPSYANARPSNSGPQGFNHQNIPPPPPPPIEEEPMFDPWPEHNVTTTPPPPDHTDNDKENGKKDDEGNAAVDSPLSPTSLEILAEIKKEPAKPRKIVRIISGKKSKESSRLSEEATPKLKRAPPVVDAAYGRRW